MILLLLICWPVAELLVAIEVAQAIGILATVLLLIVSWPLGLWLVRSEGRAAWRRLSVAVAEGRPPAREVLDGALIMTGGALLIVPGFITDVIGLVLLAPPRAPLPGWDRAQLPEPARGPGHPLQRWPRSGRCRLTATDVDNAQLHP